METEMIVEAFNNSINVHGLRYIFFIGDGDSSVYSSLQENVEYGWRIKKIECKNHVIKNFTKALYKIANNTKLPIKGRKLLKSRIPKLKSVAGVIIKKNAKNPSKIQEDVLNGLSHVFGEHSACKSYYCKWKKADENNEMLEPDINNLHEIKSSITLWALISAAYDVICAKAGGLGTDSTNVAENFMSLLAKLNCGKRVNLAKNGSYMRRSHVTGLYQMKGSSWHVPAWKSATKSSPGIHFKKYITRKQRISLAQKKSVRRKLYFTRKPIRATKDVNYGPNVADPVTEVDREVLQQCVQKKKESFVVSPQKIKYIGMVCKRKEKTACHNHVKRVLYKNSFYNKDTMYGINNEIVAKQLFSHQYNKPTRPAGLFIDEEYGFLAASPDGILLDDSAIIEVKCFPSLIRKGITLHEAAKSIKGFPLSIQSDGQLVINKKHDYYYQIQGQLRITKKEKCYFISFIEATKPIVVLEILKDDVFINNMLSKLTTFYDKFVIPEIILRRVPKKLRCLDML